MKNSNVVSIHEYKINKTYYSIGVLIGALRAELENGAVDPESVYNLLTDRVKSAISSDLAFAGGVDR